MANMLDYLNWRGDLTFEQAAFNEVDSLIFCWLSYVALDGIVPADCSEESSLTIKEVADLFFKTHNLEQIMNSKVSFTKTSVMLLKEMAETKRFAGVRLTGFVNRIDYTKETQFCAMTALLAKNLNYVVYRGTDDTLIGWKEDFNMSFLPMIPAQQMALSYLENVTARLRGSFYVGGHSKGGNLSIYAGVRASERVRRKILQIYNHDGPGFRDLRDLGDAYQKMQERIRTFVPESAVVGMLLERSGEYVVVKSNNRGLYQHDAMSWEVLGAAFVTVKELSSGSVLVNEIVSNWLKEISPEQRENFVDTLFKILDKTKTKNLEDLNAEKGKLANSVLKEVNGLDKQTKGMLTSTLAALFKEGNSAIRSSIRNSIAEKKK